MSADAIARAAAARLAPRLGRRLPAAVDRALATATPATATPATATPATAPTTAPPAALDGIAGWMVHAARAVEAADVADPQALVDRLWDALGAPPGASPAIARAVLVELVAAAAVDAKAA